jgi:pyridoxine 5-phosphate synthase
MVRLSVNVNKVATVRNSRGGHVPSVIEAVHVCVDAGAPGITLHPRADQRHIRRTDVYEVARALRERALPDVELNLEGDPRPDWLAMVEDVRPHQATLVPVRPGEVTSEAGWGDDTDPAAMRGMIERLKQRGIRVSVFVDPLAASIEWAARAGADRVELYTEPFARAFASSPDAGRVSFERYSAAARRAHELGLGINAGHDLDLENLTLFRALPQLDEVSIGHALIGRALFVGLDRVVREYLDVLRSGAAGCAV